MNNIPKKIHYCWFGKNKKNELIEKCILSWKKNLKNYEIIEWNEDNFDINSSNEYVKCAYKNKKWAFVSDYVRLKVLYEYGGIYLDTDMEVLKSFDDLLSKDFFIGIQNRKFEKYTVACGIIGTKKNNYIIKYFLDYYNKYSRNNFKEMIVIVTPVTQILKKIGFGKIGNKDYEKIDNSYVFSREYFYPYYHDEKFNLKFITNKTYTIHHWEASWLSIKDKFILKIINLSKKYKFYYFLIKLKNIFR